MVGLYYSASILAGRASAPYVLPPCTRLAALAKVGISRMAGGQPGPGMGLLLERDSFECQEGPVLADRRCQLVFQLCSAVPSAC